MTEKCKIWPYIRYMAIHAMYTICIYIYIYVYTSAYAYIYGSYIHIISGQWEHSVSGIISRKPSKWLKHAKYGHMIQKTLTLLMTQIEHPPLNYMIKWHTAWLYIYIYIYKSVIDFWHFNRKYFPTCYIQGHSAYSRRWSDLWTCCTANFRSIGSFGIRYN